MNAGPNPASVITSRATASTASHVVPTVAARTAAAWARCSTSYTSATSVGIGPVWTHRVMSEQ